MESLLLNYKHYWPTIDNKIMPIVVQRILPPNMHDRHRHNQHGSANLFHTLHFMRSITCTPLISLCGLSIYL